MASMNPGCDRALCRRFLSFTVTRRCTGHVEMGVEVHLEAPMWAVRRQVGPGVEQRPVRKGRGS